MSEPVDLYDNVYGDFASGAEADVRRAAYGDDIGFRLLASDDMTADAAMIARRWHDARESHRRVLVEREGEANFAGLQRFLSCVHRLSEEGRVSRYGCLADRQA